MTCEDRERSVAQMFRTVKTHLYRARPNGGLANMVKDPLLLRIFERTMEVTAKVKRMDKAMQRDPRSVRPSGPHDHVSLCSPVWIFRVRSLALGAGISLSANTVSRT
jgi:hypothetical protein